MKRQLNILMSLAFVGLSACGGADGSSSESVSGTSDDESSRGTFEAALGDRSIKVAVTCEALSHDEVWFYSDQADYSVAADTNGDGVAVNGQPSQRDGLTLALDINLDGKTFTANSSIDGQIPGYKPLQLQLNGRRLSGSGTMLGEVFPLPVINFELVCD